jgi:hypothetical protein
LRTEVKVNRDTELEIFGSRAGNYAVRVACAAAGGKPVVTLDLDVENVLSVRQLLESTLLVSCRRLGAFRSLTAPRSPG